jgi:hypothetical protein
MTEIQQMARPLAEVDPEVYEAVRAELERQNSRIELIASENFTSEAVLEATGSVLTSLRTSRGTVPSSFSGPSTRTSSRTPVRRPTKRPMPLSSSRATPSWA